MLPSRVAGLSIFLTLPEPGALGLVGGVGPMAGTDASTAGTRGAVGQRGCNVCFCSVMEGSNKTPRACPNISIHFCSLLVELLFPFLFSSL